MTFQIQYASDFHLEHHDKRNDGYLIPSMFLKPSAPYLALCGDIGNPDLIAYGALLGWCSRSWKEVFMVAGNHEFYNYRSEKPSDIPTRLAKMREICSHYKNVHFLDCDSYLLPEHNLRILGCTLWSDTSIGDEKAILTYMNDARNILYEKEVHLHPSLMANLHFQHKEWLFHGIQKAKETNEDVLVLTHYLPTFKLIHQKYADNPMNMCFASDCEDLIQPPVKAWICGHSHTGVHLEMNGVKCAMNPHGYPGERNETRNPQAVLSLGTKETVVEI